MSAAELQGRALQAALQRRDALFYGLGWKPVSSPVLAASGPAGKFFFNEDDIPRLIGVFRRVLPQEAERVIVRARKICNHEFDLLGYSSVPYGPEINWSRDAVHGREAPLIPWYRIDLFDFSRIGDPKVTWEINRHQHFVTLAKAWRLTADAQFVSELIDQWRCWLDQNPYPLGINWASSLEVGFRSLSWLWVRALLSGCAHLPPDFNKELTDALAVHGSHIERYLSTYSSANTHLLGEAVALMFIGLLCPEISASPDWWKRGWAIVQEQLERQVLPDGMHFEQSTYYHVYALDFFLHARIMAARNQLHIPQAYDESLQRMANVLAALCASGSPPGFGDDDGGRVFDPGRNRPEHLSDPLSTAAVLYGRADWKRICQNIREETLWLLGPEAAAEFERLPPKPAAPPRIFSHAGIYRFGDLHGELILDAGPHGTGRGGHGHADALSFTWTDEKDAILCDPGTYTYPEATGRNLFRGTGAHNTLEIDSQSQAEEAGPFAWSYVPQTTVESCIMEEEFQFFRAFHTGYTRLRAPVIHTRWIVHLKDSIYIVRDVASGEGVHQLRASWHLTPEPGAQIEPGGAVSLSRDEAAPSMCFAGDRPWKPSLEAGFVSPAYGMRQSAFVLQLGYSGSVPAELAIVLCPRAISRRDVTLRYNDLRSIAGTVSVYEFRLGTEIDLFLFSRPGYTWHLGEWSADAEFFLLRTDNEGSVLGIVAASISHLAYGGREILSNENSLKWLDWKASALASLDLAKSSVP